MLVHRRVTPGIKFAGTHLYMWMERELKDSAKNLFVQIVRESCQKCVAPKDTHTPPTNSFWFEPPRLSLQTTKCYNLMNEHNIIQTRK